MKLLEGPRVVNPSNARSGLYMLVLREAKKSLKEYYPELKRLAASNGHDPEGAATVGMRCSRGLGTVTNAVWFHDKKAPGRTARQMTSGG